MKSSGIDYINKYKTEKTENVKKVIYTEEKVENQKVDKVNDYYNSLNEAEKAKFRQTIGYKLAKNSYFEYWKLCYPDYIPTRFNKFLCDLAQNIVARVENAKKPNATEEDIRKGTIRVLISVPPQHGKSETITKTLPSWFVGRNPDYKAILTAYNADLAEGFEDKNRQKTRDLGKRVFGIEISDSQNNKTEYGIKNHDGSVYGTGITGGITSHRADLLIIDDPYKNSLEANNPQIRKSIENVFRDSIVSRMQPKGSAIIVIQTRWHEEDLCGILSKEEGWFVINIPAVCEDEIHDPLHRKEGQTLCPELGFDTEWAERTRKAVGEKVWNALYMGKPTIDGGEIFKREWFKHYTDKTRPQVFDSLTMSCDLSFGGLKQSNDPCAIQVWGKCGANHYLLMRVKKRLTFTEMCEKIKSVVSIYPQIKRKIVEKKANGQSVIDTLNSELGGFIAYDPKMDSKIARANAITYLYEAGNVFFPDKTIDGTIEEMEEEMMKFPNGAHDDEVDAMTQYLINSEVKLGGRVEVDNRFTLFARAIRSLEDD